jgi:ribonuclease HI
MAKKAPKYYVVWKGIKPGIYSTWNDCRQQIQGFTGALYKAFPTIEEAEKAFGHNAWNYIGKKTTEQKTPVSPPAGAVIKDSWSVDAACSGNPGIMEYRCVHTTTGQQIFHCGPFPEATSNIGEFLAIVHALALLKNMNSDLPIYSDSKTGMAWVRKKKANTTIVENNKNREVMEMVKRAENWLKTNTYSTKIIKWDTGKLGEIPADFGRK